MLNTVGLMLFGGAILCTADVAEAAPLPGLIRIEVLSSQDGERQPCAVVPSPRQGAQPLLVFLHPWSYGYDGFDLADWRGEAFERGWHVLMPHFRGPNSRPEACGSSLARQDVLDAVSYVRDRYAVDDSRIYLAGVSGGGHMAMVMAAHAPALWAAASAWAGISDLAAWHGETKAAKLKYAEDIERVVGGPPGASAEVDAQLRFRSPVHHLALAKDLPLDLNTGIHDGHKGSVPIHHTLDAFNAVARARGDVEVDAATVARLSRRETLEGEEEQDPSYGRVLHLRRHAGPSRVTIFEGGHEGIAAAACAWLEGHRRESP